MKSYARTLFEKQFVRTKTEKTKVKYSTLNHILTFLEASIVGLLQRFLSKFEPCFFSKLFDSLGSIYVLSCVAFRCPPIDCLSHLYPKEYHFHSVPLLFSSSFLCHCGWIWETTIILRQTPYTRHFSEKAWRNARRSRMATPILQHPSRFAPI